MVRSKVFEVWKLGCTGARKACHQLNTFGRLEEEEEKQVEQKEGRSQGVSDIVDANGAMKKTWDLICKRQRKVRKRAELRCRYPIFWHGCATLLSQHHVQSSLSCEGQRRSNKRNAHHLKRLCPSLRTEDASDITGLPTWQRYNSLLKHSN